jgi:hypothetical protein
MFTPKACTATCVLDGQSVTLTYFPDTTLLRITDAAGRCMRETRWPAPWRTLLATLREFSETDMHGQISTLLDEVPATPRAGRIRLRASRPAFRTHHNPRGAASLNNAARGNDGNWHCEMVQRHQGFRVHQAG